MREWSRAFTSVRSCLQSRLRRSARIRQHFFAPPRNKRPALAIHGGAGAIARAQMTPRRAAEYRDALKAALGAGWRVLGDGGSSLDAVCAAVVALEDDPLFNAGRGAALNAAGDAELDAAIMDGATLGAGSVAAVRRVKNPVLVARAVMESTPHVLL